MRKQSSAREEQKLSFTKRQSQSNLGSSDMSADLSARSLSNERIGRGSKTTQPVYIDGGQINQVQVFQSGDSQTEGAMTPCGLSKSFNKWNSPDFQVKHQQTSLIFKNRDNFNSMAEPKISEVDIHEGTKRTLEQLRKDENKKLQYPSKPGSRDFSGNLLKSGSRNNPQTSIVPGISNEQMKQFDQIITKDSLRRNSTLAGNRSRAGALYGGIDRSATKNKNSSKLSLGGTENRIASVSRNQNSSIQSESRASQQIMISDDPQIEPKMMPTNDIVSRLQQIVKLGRDQKMLKGLMEEETNDRDPTPDFVEGIFIFDRATCFDTCYISNQFIPPKQKILVYDHRSLNLFEHSSKFRQWIVRITHSNIFETFIVLAIFLNSLVLACTDYSDRDNKTQYNMTLEHIYKVFSYIFIFECLLKLTAMGFVMHNKSYLRDPWNGLDFLVVLSGLFEIFLGDKGGISVRALRILRVIRPLKTINAFPKMRRLISALLSSLPTLANAVLFMMFIFLLFGILGVQQFGSGMYQRCRFQDDPNPDGTWPFDESIPQLCSKEFMGNFECPSNLYCHGPQDGELSQEMDDIINDELIDYGIAVFDNLGIGFITVFQMITLEGWTKIMYNMMDSNIVWMAITFSILLVVIGSFFLLNVILAVLAEALTKVDEIEQKLRKKRDYDIYMSLKRRELQDEIKRLADPNVIIIPLKTNSEALKNGGTGNKTSQVASADLKKDIAENADTERGLLQHQDELKHSSQRQRSLIRDDQQAKQKMSQSDMIPSASKQNILLSDCNQHQQNQMTRNTMATPLESERPQEDERGSVASLIPLQEIGEVSQESIRESLQAGTPRIKNKQYPLTSSIEHSKETKDVEPQLMPEFLDKTNRPSTIGKNSLESVNSSVSSLRPARSYQNCAYKYCFIVCSHFSFTLFITILIILNTIALAMESYPPNKSQQEIADTINEISSWCFLVEMIIKLIGLGVKDYMRDAFNIFDACLVIISLVDHIILYTPQLSVGSSGGALSAFRSIRLLRVFKLARSWTSFRQLLQQIVLTIKEVAYFLVLLVICMFIFALLGMELYGQRVKFAEDGTLLKGFDGEPSFAPRNNFDNFYMAITSIFIVFIGEDWQILMHSHYRVEGISALIFFPVLYICLNLILLNLFLAILLQNFDIASHSHEKQEDYQIKSMLRFKQQANKIIRLICCKKQKTITADDFALRLSEDSLVDEIVIEDDKEVALKEQTEKFQSMDGSSLQESEIRELEKEQNNNQLDQQIQFSTNRANILDNNSERSITSVIDGSNIKAGNSVAQELPADEMDLEPVRPGYRKSSTLHQKIKELDSKASQPEDEGNAPQGKLKRSALFQSLTFQHQKMKGKFNIEKEVALFKRKKTLLKPSMKNMSIAAIKKFDFLVEGSSSRKKNIDVQGMSCFVFDPQNFFRRLCKAIVEFEYYESIVMGLICISTILLTLDNPLNDQNGTLSLVLEKIDIGLTIAFTLECIINIILRGFAFNGVTSYMRDSWNILDFLIVIFSLVNIAAAGVDLGIIKLFRILRVLRPLRVLKRNLGMKIQVISLLNSIPGIMHLLFISLLLLMLFGIQGVNFFAGKTYYCNMNNMPEKVQAKIKSEWDCYDYGGEWVQTTANFDNVFWAMMTMFTMMTTEGWAVVMWQLVDTTEIHQMPSRNNQPLYIVFCCLFLIFGSLFILNLFVGVVINTFNSEKDKVSNNNMLTKLQLEYLEVIKNCYQTQPERRFTQTGNKVRDFCRKIAQADSFNNMILGCIILNTVCLSIKWFGEPKQLTEIMEWVNFGFTVVYTIEMFIKLVAYKASYYEDGWNNFDFLIVLFAWVGLISQVVFNINVGALTTVVRAFRILRVLKLIRKAKSLHKIMNTFMLAIPELANVGALLFLFLFLFAILGVFLFSEVRLQTHMNSHANFQNFGVALLTLFRVATGEGWQDIMYDCARTRDILFKCVQSQTYEERQRDGINGCGSFIAYPYFISFTLVVSLIFLNLFIAIILEGQLQATQQQEARISEETRESFVKAWTKYDPDATGFIKVDELPEMILDLVEEEYYMRKRIGTKKSAIMFNLTGYPEVKVLMKIRRNITLSSVEQFINSNTRVQDQINWEFCRFIGRLAVPLYNKLTNYNFHDTLNALAKSRFTLQYRQEYQEREKRREIANTNLTYDDLPYYDRVLRESAEYWELDIQEQEKLLEADDPDFQKVIDRLENKGQNDVLILRLNDVRKLRVKSGQKIKNLMDLNSIGNDVLDSSCLIGAQRIQQFLLERKKRKLMLQKLSMERRKISEKFIPMADSHQATIEAREAPAILEMNDSLADKIIHASQTIADFQSVGTNRKLASFETIKLSADIIGLGKSPKLTINNLQLENDEQDESSISKVTEKKAKRPIGVAFRYQRDITVNQQIRLPKIIEHSSKRPRSYHDSPTFISSLTGLSKKRQRTQVKFQEINLVQSQTKIRRAKTKLIDSYKQDSTSHNEVELTESAGQKKSSFYESSQANGMNQPVSQMSDRENDTHGGYPKVSIVNEPSNTNEPPEICRFQDMRNAKLQFRRAVVIDSKGSEAGPQSPIDLSQERKKLVKQNKRQSSKSDYGKNSIFDLPKSKKTSVHSSLFNVNFDHQGSILPKQHQ